MSKLPFLQILDALSPYVAHTRTRVEEEQKDVDGNTTKFISNELAGSSASRSTSRRLSMT